VRILILPLSLLLGLASATAVPAQETPDFAVCTKPGDTVAPLDTVAQCNRLLDLGHLSDGDTAALLNGRGSANDDAGNYEKAIADYDKAIGLKPDYDEAYNNRGVAYDNVGNPRQAILDYSMAIRLDPQYAEAYNNRSGSYEDLGDHERALADINRAIALDPDIPEYFNNRGNVYSSVGDFDSAIRDYNKAIEMNPNYANAFNGRGNAYSYGKGEYENAIRDYSKALELNPDQTNARWAKGVFLFVLARYGEAEEILVQHVARRPDDPYGIMLLYLARRHQQRDGSGDLDQQAAKLDSPDWPMPLVRLYQGRISAEELDRKIAAAPSLSALARCEADFYMGEIDLVSGRADVAKKRFQAAVDVCPDDYGELSGAKAELARL
jgi:lipoprotein NlpI